MMKLRYLILCLFISIFYSYSQGSYTGIPRVILDTDFGPDYDDVGAIALLHCAANDGRVEILSTLLSNRHPLSAPCLDVVNMFYNRSDLHIGAPKKGNICI